MKSDKEKLSKLGIAFEVRSGGSTASIVWGSFVWTYGQQPTKEKGRKIPLIVELCRVVKINARTFLRKNKIKQKPHKTLQHYNMKNIQNVLGQNVLAIDLNACYWEIAHQEGFISDKTYERGLKHKKERLCAIGNLNKQTTTTSYKPGQKPETKVIREDTAILWDHIIYRTFKIYESIKKECGAKFYMWLTDCAFVHPDCESIVTKHFEDNGFGYTVKKLTIDKIHRNKLYWTIISEGTKKDKQKSISIPRQPKPKNAKKDESNQKQKRTARPSSSPAKKSK